MAEFLQTVENRPFSSSLVPLLQNESYKNDFDLYGNEPAEGTRFHVNGFETEAQEKSEMACCMK